MKRLGLLYTIKFAFSSRTKCIYGLVELLCERDDVISLAFQNAQDMKDGAMDHPPWEKEGVTHSMATLKVEFPPLQLR